MAYAIEKRIAVGSAKLRDESGRKTWRNVPLIAVMVNGITIACFLKDAEADAFIQNYMERNPLVRHQDSNK
jgi:hypothetical protein